MRRRGIRESVLAGAFLLIVSAASAEVLRLPLFFPPPSYGDSSSFFPSFETWLVFDHVMNQAYEPEFGHALESGVRFSFFSSPGFALWSRVREIFQFMRNPGGDWLFATRDLVTDLALAGEAKLDPISLAFGFRHDCKHDVDGSFGRDLLHDALFTRASLLKPVALGYAEGATLDAALEIEINLPPVFQNAGPEVDFWRVSAELRAVPFAFYDALRAFIETRASAIGRRAVSGVSIDPSAYWDWRAAAGLETQGVNGAFRTFFAVDRYSDTWKNVAGDPAIVVVFGVGLFCYAN